MKVVLFCGGLGTRLREFSETIPKPLVPVGSRPILWHLMKYYAHFGHTEFILCLGYKGEMIREYFLKYNECLSNDFVLSDGGRTIELLNRDIDGWRITFAETGARSNIGQRLRAVRSYLGDDPMFLANYADGLSDLPLSDYVREFAKAKSIAKFMSVRPAQSFHTVHARPDGGVEDIRPMQGADVWINGGFFALRREIFDHMEEGEELVEAPFRRLIERGLLETHRYEGFWAAMDTFKDKVTLDDRVERGDTPWKVWRNGVAPGR